MKIQEIYEDFHDKMLYLVVWDRDKFCILMEEKGVDTDDWGNPYWLYYYVDWEGGYIRLKEKRLDYLLHELSHYIRDIAEKIWYEKEALHEYPSYAIEWYTKQCCKTLQLTNIGMGKKKGGKKC